MGNPLADAPVIAWLLESREPAIRRLVRRDLLDERADDEDPLAGPIVAALLAGQEASGGFGGHAYDKWGGAHWRLISLVELGIPAGEPRAVAAADTVLTWLTGAAHRRNVPVIEGLARRCGSQEGNALAVASRLGLAGSDPRVAVLAESLVGWQWPDGGWNCDRTPSAHRSSFNETLGPIWGLHEYAIATTDSEASAAARRGAELLLEHRVFRALATGEPMHDEWLVMHWPPYWHYEILNAMVILSRLGLAADERAADAVEAIRQRRQRNGRWRASSRWWKPPPTTTGGGEAVDWRADASGDRLVTLRALTVLSAAESAAGSGGEPNRPVHRMPVS